ncbi:MAG: acyl-phosphate glycerol 3-phosphate acyltransferase [Candidatus Omnitrophica bacterium CG23_combo_of_CG06-09_8_20_14_all_40_11]|nr:MAG: acyl-phosphate glycerol 3-phosphate acyltransferase [Candidatus Omnitrophica bacterium CG23_combo_of_CG06-09_8_20_14_all_40_11]
MPWIILGILISYLIGSIPTGYIFGRALKGIDIRKFGSGNVGATNALRILGKPAGIAVLVLDILKGFVVVFFLGNIIAARITGISDITTRVLLGLSCICGHNWTIFLRFKGGKGMATTLGVLLGLAVKAAGIKVVFALVILTWLVVFMSTRIVSLASILSGIALPVYMFLFKQPRILIYTSTLLCIFIILRHKSNLKKLLRGEEKRLF